MKGIQARHGLMRDATAIAILGLMLGGFLIPQAASAEQIVYVDASNTTGPWDGTATYPYTTIGEAIAIPDATMIYVSAGTYVENLVITHSLSLIGASALTTIIDGSGNGHTLAATGTEDNPLSLDVSGLTLQNAGKHGYANLACSFVTSGTIQSNTFQNSQEGDDIQLDHCAGVTIHNNIIANAHITGISLILCTSCTLDANTIQYNQKGISLTYTTTTTITGNTITHNTIYGAYLQQSSQNSFTGNHFSLNGEQANDPCTNSWSVNHQGNYWDDYTGYDANNDGIGDITYEIPGGDNIDAYPLGIFQNPPQQDEDNTLPVVLSMTVSPTTASTGDLVNFTGEGQDSDGMIQGYSWESSISGHLSSARTFTSTSLAAGQHTISFSVMDNDGGWSTPRTATVTITPAPTPVIDSITPVTSTEHQPITFQGHAENAGDVDVQYRWLSTQDGILSTQAFFTLANLSIGVHTIQFQIKVPSREWSAPATQIITIESQQQGTPGDQTVIADAGGPYECRVGTNVSLDASGSTGPSGIVLYYSWNFGDGSTGSGMTVNHSYNASGTYSLMLTVTSPGCISSVSTTMVTVSATTAEPNESDANPLLSLPPMSYVLLGVVAVIGILALVVVSWRRS
jgi:parallel beta-helix repeat protein